MPRRDSPKVLAKFGACPTGEGLAKPGSCLGRCSVLGVTGRSGVCEDRPRASLTVPVPGRPQRCGPGVRRNCSRTGPCWNRLYLSGYPVQAFGPLGLHRVELRTNPTNKRSQSVAQRLGFTQEGVLREAAAFPDERRDDVVYGLLAREWHEGAN